jgi:signal peptidase
LRWARRAAGAAVTVFLLVCLGLGLVMLAPAALGYQRYVITSGSMTGTYDRGSIVFSHVVPIESLRVGDVITYAPPAGAGPRGLVTHRLAERRRRADGRLEFRTKGDANPAADPWVFTLDGPTQARAVAHLPLVGYAFGALAVREVRMIAIGLPAALLALAVLMGMWREAGRAAGAARRNEQAVES